MPTTKSITKHNKTLTLVLIVIWVLICILPIPLFFQYMRMPSKAWMVYRGYLVSIFDIALIFFLNYLWLVPHYLLNSHRARKFFWINIGIMAVIWVLSYIYGLIAGNNHPSVGLLLLFVLAIGWFLFKFLFVGCAVGIRFIQNWYEVQMQMKEEKEKHAEAELTWLKSQINPHFLFNTLNNISSLVQIDGNAAQESIGQLSDLLRYALYESNEKTVPLEGEVEFMNNYIDLMKLRCNELAEVTVDMPLPDRSVQIVPLLFVSLLENAFKHGVNSRMQSFVHVTLEVTDTTLSFTVVNSFFPKTAPDHIGSGIGIDNTQRRLELAYPNHYEYVHEQRGDTYFAQIVLKDCL